MISENIKKYRKKKGFTQEELAVRMNVVRQTVSKWEQGLSVPDAEALIRLAGLLDVSVSKLLGMEDEANSSVDFTDELTRLNALIDEKNKREQFAKRVGEKRGLILLLSFATMIITLGVKLPVVSIALSGICLLSAVIVLYRDLELLTTTTADDMKLSVLRVATLVNISVLLLVLTAAILTVADVLTFTEHGEKMFALLIVSGVMIFTGVVSTKLPSTRHTGLRLPWTVSDKDTWNLAHRVIGYISLPVALLYIGCSLTVANFEVVTLVAVLLWIGIPSIISLMYFQKKMRGEL